MAEKIALVGATDAQIAAVFEVSETTINAWKRQHVEFAVALKKGKLEADASVVHSLYQRATGYSVESEKIFQYEGKVVRAKTVEKYPPDTTACIFWLKNRDKDNWRDKHDHEHSGSIAVTITSDDAKL